VHPDNDYTTQLVDFLLQFGRPDHVAFVIKAFGLADLINLIAGRFYFEYASAITYAIWLVTTGKFYEIAWSYYTRVSPVVGIWPVHRLSPCMMVTRNDACRFVARINLSVESKYYCLEKMLFEVIDKYPYNRYAQVIVAIIMNIMSHTIGNAVLYDVKLAHAILQVAKKFSEYSMVCVQDVVKRGFTIGAIGGDRYAVLVNTLCNSNLYGLSENQMIEVAKMEEDISVIPYNYVASSPQLWANGFQSFYAQYGDDQIVVFVDENHVVEPQILGQNGEATNKDGVNVNLLETLTNCDELFSQLDSYDVLPFVPQNIEDAEVEEEIEFIDYVPQTIDEVITHILSINDHHDDLETWEWVFDLSYLSWNEQHLFLTLYEKLNKFAEKFSRGRATSYYVGKIMDLVNMHGLTYTFREIGVLYAVMHAYNGFEGRIYWSGPTAAVLMANVQWFATSFGQAHHRWLQLAKFRRLNNLDDGQ